MGFLYQKRKLKANKMRRKINAVRGHLQRLRVFLALLMIIFISWSCVRILKLPEWYIDKEKLANADPSVLKIQGNLITPNYKVINMVRQTELPHTQIFRLDTSELEKNISRLQPVKKVYIRRYWFPARLVITIDERTPAFLLAPNLESEPNSILSADGVLIDRDYLPFDSSIKAKKLLTYGVKNGVDEIWDKRRVEEISELVKAIEAYSNWQVQYLDFRKQNDIYIMLDKYLIRFGEIDSSALKRAKKIASIIPKLSEYNNIEYIDLRWEDSSYLRLKGEKEDQKPITISDDKQQSSNNTNPAPKPQETKPEPVEKPAQPEPVEVEESNHQTFD